MKVLKPGRPQKGWAEELKCTGAGNMGGGCGALLLVEQDDLFETSSIVRDETDYYTMFKCPECGVLTDLDSNMRVTVYGLVIPNQKAWDVAHPKPPTAEELKDLNSAP